MSLDIRHLPSAADSCEAGYTFEARYPDGTATGARITVRGPDSRAARDHAARRFADLQARELAAKKAGREPDPLRPDEIEEQLIDLAVVYTMGWEGIDEGGAPLPYSPTQARTVYRLHPWLRSQVTGAAQDLGNFVRPSSAASSSTPQPSTGST